MPVTLAEGVPEALAALKRSVNLVLTDTHMPGQSSLQLAARLRRDHPDLPVLLFTGMVDLATRAQAQAIRVDNVLREPSTREKRLKTVQDYFAHEPARATGTPFIPVGQPQAPSPTLPPPLTQAEPPANTLTELCKLPGVLSAVRFHADGQVERMWNLPLQEATLETLNLLSLNMQELAERLGSGVLEGHLPPLYLPDRIVLLGFLNGQGVAFVVRNAEVMERVSHLLLLSEWHAN